MSSAEVGARYGEEAGAHGTVEFAAEGEEDRTAHGIEYGLGDRSVTKLHEEEGYLTVGLECTGGDLVHLGLN